MECFLLSQSRGILRSTGNRKSQHTSTSFLPFLWSVRSHAPIVANHIHASVSKGFVSLRRVCGMGTGDVIFFFFFFFFTLSWGLHMLLILLVICDGSVFIVGLVGLESHRNIPPGLWKHIHGCVSRNIESRGLSLDVCFLTPWIIVLSWVKKKANWAPAWSPFPDCGYNVASCCWLLGPRFPHYDALYP